MNGTLTILSPVPEGPPEMPTGSSGWNLPNQIRLGVLSNGKPNTSHLLDGILEVLTANPRFTLTERLGKESASMPASAAALARLSEGADLVVTATAD